MKRLLTAIGALAVINLLGILGAAGWLAATDRLSAERVEAIRQILHEPVPAEQARLAAEQAEAEAGAAQQEEPLPAGPPVGSGELVSMQGEQSRADEFRAQRLAREESTLGQTIVQETRKLDDARREFERERDAFETRSEQIAALKGDEQFQAALSVLTQVKPDKAKAMLQEIIDGRAGVVGVGDAGGMTGMDRAVAYLDEMDEMVRGKIMAEFVDEAPTLAADLLERLRTFGLMADASGGTGP
jgi:hypothetical protein